MSYAIATSPECLFAPGNTLLMHFLPRGNLQKGASIAVSLLVAALPETHNDLDAGPCIAGNTMLVIMCSLTFAETLSSKLTTINAIVMRCRRSTNSWLVLQDANLYRRFEPFREVPNRFILRSRHKRMPRVCSLISSHSLEGRSIGCCKKDTYILAGHLEFFCWIHLLT